MTKEDKAGISKTVIQIAGREVICTPEQIKDLKEALDKMYPAPQSPVKEYVPYSVPYPVYPKPYRWDLPYISYSANADNSVSLKTL